MIHTWDSSKLCLTEKQKFRKLLFTVDTHKNQKATLDDLFQKLHGKKKTSKTIQIFINS